MLLWKMSPIGVRTNYFPSQEKPQQKGGLTNVKKLLLLLPLLAFILACQTLMGRPAGGSENTSTEPTRTITDPAAPNGITIVRLTKQGGDLSSQLSAEAQKAAALGQIPIVYFDASW
jgi:hypothetical protein